MNPEEINARVAVLCTQCADAVQDSYPFEVVRDDAVIVLQALELLRKDSVSEMTLQMLVSAGFVSEKKVSLARKIAMDLISKQPTQRTAAE